MDLVDELERIVVALGEGGIDYALCGGFAVALHGHVRATRDIDLLVRRESLDVVRAALVPLGFVLKAGPIPFSAGTPNEREIHRVSKVESGAVATIDLLVVTPVFEPVWGDRIHLDWRGRTVCVVSLDGLARMKRLAGRRQDLADLENLGIAAEDGAS